MAAVSPARAQEKERWERSVIELKNLRAGYGNTEVLQGVSMCFLPGQITVLLGPNGSGKSTLLKVALGMLPGFGGEVLYNGEALESLSSRQIARQAAFLAQSRNVPNISVEKMVLHGRFPYLSYPRTYQAKDRKIAKEAMEQMGVLEFAGRLVPELSGGQRQKVYLAMALAQQTETIFMDEPTTYLDIASQLHMMEHARILAEQNKAVVMVLHDLGLALRTADCVVVLSDGQVAQSGTPEEIYEGGVLRQVFDVNVRRVRTEDGWQYFGSLS